MIYLSNKGSRKRNRSILLLTLFIALLALTAGCSSDDGDTIVVAPEPTVTYDVYCYAPGLDGTLVLQNNSADDLTLTTNWFYYFATPIANGSSYDVTVKTQPVTQTCYVTDGSGTISGSDVFYVVVECYDFGALDASFDTDGIVTHNSAAGGNAHDFGNSVAVDSSGRIVVTGYSRGATSYDDMAIWRYNSDGTLDTTFDTDGIVTHHNAAGGGSSDYGYSIAVDSSGRIIVAGYSYSGSSADMVIWRYNANGTLDSSFDSDGIVTHHNAVGGNDDMGYSLALDSSGRIIVAGKSHNGSNDDMAIWRYNSDGTLDTTFDTDGIVTHNSAAGGNGDDMGYSLALDSSGKILVTGYSYNATNTDMAIWRYNSDATLDTTFGTGGFVTHNSAAGGNWHDKGNSIAVDSSDRIVVTGYSRGGSNYDMAIWRYSSDGTLDSSFDTDGIVTHNSAAGGNGDDHGNSVALDSSGRIVVIGRSSNGSNDDMTIWRYSSDGTLDTTFDTDGIVTHNSTAGGNSNDEGYSITTDSTGKIVVAGYSYSPLNVDMAIWRYHP